MICRSDLRSERVRPHAGFHALALIAADKTAGNEQRVRELGKNLVQLAESGVDRPDEGEVRPRAVSSRCKPCFLSRRREGCGA